MTFHEILNNLRGSSLSSSQIVTAIIETAANLSRGVDWSDTASVAYDLEQPSSGALIQFAAKALLDFPMDRRLSEITAMLDSGAARDTGEFWIRQDAAQELVGLLGEVKSVRFSYPASLRPALLFAFDRKIKALPTEIEYAGRGTDNRLLDHLSTILDLNMTITSTSPWARSNHAVFDAELIMPPFGSDMSRVSDLPESTLSSLGIFGGRHGRISGESVAIADALQSVKGRAVLVVTEGALFRAVGVEAIAREELVHSGRLEAVMGLGPSMMFQNTSINAALLLLAPKGTSRSTIRFVNLSDEQFASRRERGRLEIRKGVAWSALQNIELSGSEAFARDIDPSSIKEEGYTLTIDRYLDHHARDAIEQLLAKSEHAELADLVEMIRPIALTQQEDGEYTVLEAAPADIAEDGNVSDPSRTISVDRVQYRKASNQMLRPGDVLIAFKGAVGKVGIVPDDVPADGSSAVWAAGQSLMILRMKGRHKLSPHVLCEYLSDEVVQEHLKSLAGGSAIQTIAMKDLKSLAIPLPDKETQAKVEAAVAERQALYRQIEQLKAQIAMARRSSWPHSELRSPQD
jgi:type I restriction-modification system DNA methylase subunit